MSPDNSTGRVVDSGYAWVVLAACFVLQTACVGFSIGGIGVATVSFGNQFPSADNEELGWIGGLRSFQFMASPLAVLLIAQLGCRVVAISGALLSGTAIALSIYCTEIWHVYVLYSIVAGLGIACTFTSNFHILDEYFDKKKNIAFPVAALGNALGVVIFPYVLQNITDAYGHDVALLITASLKVIEIICGLTFAPNGADYEAPCFKKIKNRWCRRSDGNKSFGEQNELSETSVKSSSKSQMTWTLENGVTVSAEDKQGNTQAVDAPQASDTPADKSTNAGSNLIGVLKMWQVWALLCNAFGWGVSMVATETLMPLYVIKRGLDANEASLGIAAIGIGFLAASLLTLAIGSLSYDRLLVYAFTTSVSGACTLLMTVSTEAVAYIVLCILFGVGMGLSLALFMSVLVQLSAPKDLPYVFGLYQFFNGLGSICGPVLVGAIQSTLGDNIGWYVSGSIGFIATVVLTPLLCQRKASSADNIISRASEEA